MNVNDVMIFFIGILCFPFVLAYENLSRKNTTVLSQSSTYDKNVASLANDGVLNTSLAFCGYTNPGHKKAWLQVDLGKPYSVKRITIIYRKEGDGPDDWKQYRFRQFYLDVSDLPAKETSTAERTRCYTDKTIYPQLPSNSIDIQCEQTARYVIVETTYDAPEDKYIGAMLEICEVEVYGCDIGRFGVECKRCPNCYSCDINNGTCSCFLHCIGNLCNYKDGRCLRGCNIGYWRSTCDLACPKNCKESKCFRSTGICNDCKAGFRGSHCDKPCPANCKDHACDQFDGKCLLCAVGQFGDVCNETCHYRCKDLICDQESGVCSTGCVKNWAGEICDRCDLKHYGENCSLECSPNCKDGCNVDTGTCNNCIDGRFMESCTDACGVGCMSGCDRYRGNCTCKPGWRGNQCDVHGFESPRNHTLVFALAVFSSVSFLIILVLFLRHKICVSHKGKSPHLNVNERGRNHNSEKPISGIYDTIKDDSFYQELHQLDGRSHYDELHRLRET